MSAQWPSFGDPQFAKLQTSDVFDRLQGVYSEPALRHMAMIAWWESRHKPGWTHPEITDTDSLVHGLHQHYQGSGSSTFPDLMEAYNDADKAAFERIMGPWAPVLLGPDVRTRVLVNEADLPARFKALGEHPGFDAVQIKLFYDRYYKPMSWKIQELGLSWDAGYAMSADRATVWGWDRAIADLEKVYNAHKDEGEGAVWAAFAKLDDEASYQPRRQWIWAGQPIYGRAIHAPHAPVKENPIGKDPDGGSVGGSGGSNGGGGAGGFRRGVPSGGVLRSVLTTPGGPARDADWEDLSPVEQLLMQELQNISDEMERMSVGIEKLMGLFFAN